MYGKPTARPQWSSYYEIGKGSDIPSDTGMAEHVTAGERMHLFTSCGEDCSKSAVICFYS